MPLSRSPPSLMTQLIPASLQLVRRQKVQHDGPRGRRDGGHIANKKRGPKAALLPSPPAEGGQASFHVGGLTRMSANIWRTADGA
jgi:hypothetical protein